MKEVIHAVMILALLGIFVAELNVGPRNFWRTALCLTGIVSLLAMFLMCQ